MEQAQVLSTGPCCMECIRLNMQCDGIVPCRRCIVHGLQGRCTKTQLPGTKELLTLVGLGQQNGAISGPVQQRPHHVVSLPTQRTFPQLAGHFMNNAQHLHSWECHPPRLENIHYPGRVPRIRTNSAPAMGTNTNRLQTEDFSDQDTLAFGTGYTRSLSTTNPVLVSSNPTYYSYVHETRPQHPAPATMSTPLFQPNRSTYRVFSTRPEIPLGDFTAPPYRHPEVLFPFPQCQPLATGSSSGPEIESEAPSMGNDMRLSGQTLPLPREVELIANMPAEGSTVTGFETASGRSHTSLGNNPLPNGQMSGNGIYGQIWDSPLPTKRGLKAAPVRVRARVTAGRDHYPYQDDRLRSKYPTHRQDALELAITFQKDHGRTKAIPPDLLDDLLEQGTDGKYRCFCCPPSREATTITPARDHVRKSLGNFPFRCGNAWCNHSSLRQADLNKHMNTCSNQTSSN